MSSALDTNPNQKPIGLFFEVLPKIGHRKAYFEYVNKLQPALAENDGLLWLKRYEEIKNKKLILSHQLWKDERSIKKWRKNNLHIIAQDAGTRIHCLDYRIRVGPCFWRWDGICLPTSLTVTPSSDARPMVRPCHLGTVR